MFLRYEQLDITNRLICNFRDINITYKVFSGFGRSNKKDDWGVRQICEEKPKTETKL